MASTESIARMKENDGRAARRQLLRRLGLVAVTFGSILSVLNMLGVGGKRRRQFRRRGDDSRGQRRQGQPEPSLPPIMMVKDEREVEQMIILGELHLVDLEVDYEELAFSPPDSYYGVYGMFCQLNFAASKNIPSEDLVRESPGCRRFWKMDLQTIARAAREYDQRQDERTTVRPLNLTAVIFHESRCGATLVANAFMAMNPEQNRVYSESTPASMALKLCGDSFANCRDDQAVRVLRDTMYLMGRSSNPKERRLFYKMESIDIRNIDIFQKTFPTTPWLFLYRDPLQVMVSHLDARFRGNNKGVHCLQEFNNPPQGVLMELERHLHLFYGQDLAEQVSYENFCAAHLASITERAVAAIRISPRWGHAIHYPDLPKVLYESILPLTLGIPVSFQERKRIIQVSSQYLTTGQMEPLKWQGDSEQKERLASDAIRAASQLFLQESYDALVKLSQADLNR